MPDLLLAKHIHKSFHKTHAVNDVSLRLLAGELYGLVGPDGAGKTTTLRLLCGALKLDAGSIQIHGYDLNQQVESARSQIGYLSQRFSLYEELNVDENLRFFAELRGMQPGEWVPRSQMILEFVGLADYRRRLAGQLSGGMKQKLGLAIALINKPRLLLLDEPTTGVDPVTRQDFWQLIIRLIGEEQVGVLVSTPYMDEAARCTRVGFMRSGQIIAEGTPQTLCTQLDGQILALSGQPTAVLLKVARSTSEIINVRRFGDQLHLQILPGTAEQVMQELKAAVFFAQGSIECIQAVPPTLEDVFLHLAKVTE